MSNRKYLFLFLWLGLAHWLPLQAEVVAPLAPEYPDTTYIHGEVLVDPWAWLKDREHPDLPSVFAAEETYAQANFKASHKLARQLYREFTSDYQKARNSFPRLIDGYRYYSKSFSNKVYSTHYRVKDVIGAKEELILDENKLSRGHDFFALDQFTVSRDGRLLAYSVDFSGNEEYQLFIKDLNTGKVRETQVINVSEAIWMQDNQRLVITTINERYQTDTIWLYDIRNEMRQLFYQESDPAFDLNIYSSAGRDLIFVQSSTRDTNQTWFLDSSVVNPELVQLLARQEKRLAYPDLVNRTIYVDSNESTPDGFIYAFPQGSSEDQNRQIIIPGCTGDPIVTSVFLHDTVAVLRRHDGFKRIEIYNLPDGSLRRIIAPEVPSDLAFWSDSDPGADSLLYSLENELTLQTIIRHDLASGRETVVDPVLDDVQYHYSNYKIDLLWVTAQDGKRIPLRLFYRKDLDYHQPHPLWLMGYGAYGDCEDPYFWDNLFPLLNRGFIYAVAHVRGGGELGDAWFQNGRLHNKVNTFTDFISCMDFLLDQGYTTSDQLVIEGGSAGGLLIGAMVNIVPDKTRLAIANVPFVDLINTMLDPELPLTQQEYEEWGNPDQEDDFRYMLSYSPYDNVRPAAYPEVLVSSAWNDIRVGYWESLKWVQKLRKYNQGPNHIIYRMHWNEGHLGNSDYRQSLMDYAEMMAYAVQLLSTQTKK